MDESLVEYATPSTDELTVALRAQRERAHEFFSRFRGSSEHIEQQLLAQVDVALRHISQLSENDAPSDEEWQRRQATLVDQELRLQQLQNDLHKRETRLVELQGELTRSHELLLAELARPRELQQPGPQADAWAKLESQFADRLSEFAQLSDALAARFSAIEVAQQQLDATRNQLAQRRQELDEQFAQVQAAQTKQNEDRLQHEIAAAELNERAQDVDQRAHLVEKHSRELEERVRHIEAREAELAENRKQLARNLRLQRAEHLMEIERRRAELDQQAAAEDAELENQLAQFTAELSRVRQQTHERGEQVDRLRQELENARVQVVRRDAENRELQQRLETLANADQGRSAETAAISAQLAEARERAESQYAAAQAALSQSRTEQEQLRSELAQARRRYDEAQLEIESLHERVQQLRRQIDQAGDAESALRIKELEQERDALVERLGEAEQMTSLSGGSTEESDELRRRFEMALDDIRALKSRNAELEEKLARASSGGMSGAIAAEGKMDWESQKKRMLAQLEADFDGDDPQEVKDKMTVEGAIQITDGIVAQKDREIEELQRLLDEQSKNIGGVAVGAAAIAQLLDSDELIRSEREKLEAMQNEWREKLRKAEIDISVERAKIARERAQLEEKLQTIAARGGDANDASGDKKKKGSRWLSRLGLSEDEK
jgi:chromosome segregation ATPase